MKPVPMPTQKSQAGKTWSRETVARFRDIGRMTLGALLILSGILAWHLSATLHDQTQGFNRYVRVDIWTAKQAEYELQRLLLILAQNRLGDPIEPTAVQHQMSLAKSALDQLKQTHSEDSIANVLDIDAVVGRLLGHLDDVQHSLSTNDQTENIFRSEQSIAQEVPKLHQLLVDLSHLQLQLQDRDFGHVKTLVSLNSTMVIGFYIIAAIFTCFLWWEADGAKQASRAASANEERFKDIAEIASDWVWETDQSLSFVFLSEKVENSMGATIDGHLGKPLSSLFIEQADDHGRSKLAEAIESRKPFRDVISHMVVDHNQEASIIRLSGKPISDSKGNFLGYRGVGTDISLAMRREERIRYLAEHDQLTGLPNRAVFQDRLRSVLDSMRESDRQGALLALDLDGFKDINDTFGHDVGDALILAVGDCLSGIIRKADLVARLGGDEFAIICRDENANDHVFTDLADRILAAFEAPFNVDGKQLSVGVSIGIARFPNDGLTVEDLMKAGDLALYGAKAKGRGCFIYFDQSMTLQLQQKRTIEVSLKRAIERNELDIVFQPQVDLLTHRVIGAEALVRWHDSELGPVPPDIFIGVAEACGLILPLGQWVLETACLEAKSWAPMGIDGVVAVNVSTAQLTQQDLVKSVEDVLARSGLPPSKLELEITESLLMGDTHGAIATLERLRALGVQLAIDDFGTGYSSLSYLKRFSVHKVKIDRSFVTDIERDDDDRRIVNAIVMLGRALNLRTIAEGVETEGQSNLLSSLGCSEAQGYLYGRPMPASRFKSYCLDHRASQSYISGLPETSMPVVPVQ